MIIIIIILTIINCNFTTIIIIIINSDALASTLSALYGKLLVVMGIAFPMAEVISTYIPSSFYEWFYLYLYFGSMLFLLYMYALMLRDRSIESRNNNNNNNNSPSEYAYVYTPGCIFALTIPRNEIFGLLINRKKKRIE